MVLLLAVIVRTGCDPTVMVTVLVSLHPAPLVPVTTYDVVTVGVTSTGLVVNDPGVHVKPAAPVAVSVADPPLQIESGAPLATSVGFAFTMMVAVMLVAHEPSEPVKV